MKFKTLVLCVLLSGLTACEKFSQEEVASPPKTQNQVAPPVQEVATVVVETAEQSQTVPPKPELVDISSQPVAPFYVDKQKRLSTRNYIINDITHIIPYTNREQMHLAWAMFDAVEKRPQMVKELAQTCDNSYYQLTYAYLLQSRRQYAEAIKYYEMSAEKGNAYAENRLGELHVLGLGVQKDMEKAKYWFGRSAKRGYAFAQWALGVWYLDVPFNKQTMILLEPSGMDFSESKLPNMRVGNNADIEKALFWLNLGSKQKDHRSRLTLDHIGKLGVNTSQGIDHNALNQLIVDADVGNLHEIKPKCEKNLHSIRQY